MNNPLSPNAFTHAPGYGNAPKIAATVPGEWVPEFIPPPPPMPTASIRRIERKKKDKTYVYYELTIHKALEQALSITYGKAIDLHPPVHGSPYWHLDLRREARYAVRCYDDQRPRVEGIRLPDGLVIDTLTLHLLPGKPKYEHVYPMLPANAFTP